MMPGKLFSALKLFNTFVGKRAILFQGLICLVLAAAWPANAQVQFTDVSISSGVGNDYYYGPTAHSLGINWIDYDNDNYPDLFMVNGPGYDAHLYRNNGDGTFSNMDNLLPYIPEIEMAGSVFADYDNDGDNDIYIYTDTTYLNFRLPNPPDGPPNLLLKNFWVENGEQVIPGQPLFVNVAAAAGVQDLADPPLGAKPGMRAKTAGWLDYNRDGWMDLYVGHFVVNSSGEISNMDRFYENNGDGTFTDVTVSSQLNLGTDSTTFRPALAFIGAHLDNDLWPDIFVVNVADPSPFFEDLIYRNNGDFTFTEITSQMPGIGDDCEAGMGIDVADIDLDGDWDVYISDLLNTNLDALPRGNVFYLNNGDGTFQDNSAPAAGLVSNNSWGVSFFDADQDGYEDLFVATTSSGGIPFLYMNNRNGTFSPVDIGAGITNKRGSATADFDRDGDLDLATISQEGFVQLFRNDTNNSNNWLEIKLTGTQSSRDAIGTLVELEIGAFTLLRQVKGGSSAHSQDDLVVHFGLRGEAQANKLRIRWPSGVVDSLENVSANQFLTVVEGSTVNPKPIINVIPANVDFGMVQTGAFSEQSVTVVNEGTQTLTVSSLSVSDSNFAVVSPAVPFDVGVNGGTQQVLLRFSPSVVGAASGVLSIASNDPDMGVETVSLSGEGIEAPAVIVYRINAGGAEFTDGNGDVFAADQAYTPGGFGYVGGLSASFSGDVSGTTDDGLYLSMRGNKPASFSYLFDGLASGDYAVTLYFTEPFYTSPGQRVFDVSMEGTVVLPGFDIYSASGGKLMAHSETQVVTVSDGQLSVDFTPLTNTHAIVSAISVVEQPDSPPTTYRINAGGAEFTDGNGDVFAADQAYTPGGFGYVGGLSASFSGDVSGTTDDGLYLSMRGNKPASFSYLFDGLASGDYAVTLYFTEPFYTSPGQRVFDVSMEGTVVLPGFDIYSASGGKLMAHSETQVVTVSDGQLSVDFTPLTNTHAIVSAISVVAQGSGMQLQAESALQKTAGTEPAGAFDLSQNYPNPFNPETVIRYRLAEGSRVSLRIYDVLGREVWSSGERYREAGEHQVVWRGRDRSGNRVASGVYIYKLQTDRQVRVRKMILMQ